MLRQYREMSLVTSYILYFHQSRLFVSTHGNVTLTTVRKKSFFFFYINVIGLNSTKNKNKIKGNEGNGGKIGFSRL